MLYEVCEITKGVLKHYYVSKGKPRMSKDKATLLTLEKAREVLAEYPHRNLFIQSEYDCHFRKVDPSGYCEEVAYGI